MRRIVAPTDPLPVVRYDAKAGERSVERVHDLNSGL
jgi:hypothetical protein